MRLEEVASRDAPAFAAFSDVARRAHVDDPAWVAASEEAVDWAFAESAAGRTPLRAWVAFAAGEPVARAAALAPETSVGWVGLFESVVGARQAAVAVLRACSDALTAWGYSEAEAPHSDPLTIGLQVGGFDAPQTLFSPRHPAAYLGHFEAAGFEVRERMVAPVMTRASLRFVPERLAGVTVRSLDVDRLEHDLASFHALQGQVFGGRPGREERAHDGTRRLFERILPHVDPDLVLIAEHAGSVVGTLVCLPDSWQARDRSRIDRARILSIAVRADLRRRGIGLAMASRLATTLSAKGFRSCEGVWVLEQNRAPLALSEHFGGRIGRRFALLHRRLVPR